MSELLVHTDGGARGNPGPAATGVFFELDDFAEGHGRCIGETTNNVAEYMGVLDALEQIPALLEEHTIEKIIFYLDSQLIVYQIIGEYRVKEPTLQELHARVQQRLKTLPVPYQFVHVPRKQNAEADRLVNQALDGLI